MTSAERLFKALFMYFDNVFAQNTNVDVTTDLRYKDSWTFYKRLESSLYPWLYEGWNNAFQINNQTNGRGIVIAVGDDQFRFAATTIKTLREVLNCTLPIEVFFVREDDLSVARRSYLQTEFEDVTLKKIEDYVGYHYTQFGGWAMKPFCILSSSFREVILMDADAFFLQNPEKLFDDKGYQLTGSLYFYDRTLFPDWDVGAGWLNSFLPTMSTLVPETRWYQRTSTHEQESGVIVMDKQKALLGLLSTCKLNGKTERDEITFWVGFEITQTPYAFNKFYGAVIGQMGRGGDDGSPENVCGNQLHVDINHVPLWFNGGLYRHKYDYDNLTYLEFTHYAEGEDWDFDTHCLNDHDKIREVHPEQRTIAMASIEIDKKREKDEALLEKGEWTPKKLDL
ncbi:mannosyltransferase putative-domain-containing protein [Mycotypha africana]|uniref:mannosyltransferase putative-domain-containing protein n=1 Tax=Mycotypha africana TaxID=64632 RepID=UPI002300CD3A|nr:mannosyltransferase putative-domain-containing protein [Mycotypha africana]KAI8991825.1 mannosyltransferase putative-domain-containing protein [Mycotypha africana]